MELLQRINAFVQLGDFLSQFSRAEITQKEGIPFNDLFFDGFQHQIKLAGQHNGWFTKENILYAIEGWTALLTEPHLTQWLAPYESAGVYAKPIQNTKTETAIHTPKTIAIIMAGNIPLVGFHDFLSVNTDWTMKRLCPSMDCPIQAATQPSCRRLNSCRASSILLNLAPFPSAPEHTTVSTNTLMISILFPLSYFIIHLLFE